MLLNVCCGAAGREGNDEAALERGDSAKGMKAFLVTHAQSYPTKAPPSRLIKGVRMIDVGGGWHSIGEDLEDPSPRGVPPELGPSRSPRPSRPWDDQKRGSPRRRAGRKDENKRDRGGSWGGGSREDDDSSSGGNASSGGDDNADEDGDQSPQKVTFEDLDDDDDDGTHLLVLGEGDFSVLGGGKDDDVKDEDSGDEERLRVIRMRQRATSEFQRVAAIPVGEGKHPRVQSSGV